MTNGNIIGHELQKNILLKAAGLNRISHSWLFHGVEGIGKKLVAINFARILNCRNKTAQHDDLVYDCSCSSCLKVSRSVHPDIKLLEYPDVKNIKIDDIRNDVEKQVYLSPYESEYKVFIVDGAERMNINAQNAFLKTLEEPPKQSVIILITSAEHLLLRTIRSRCQSIHFTPLAIPEVRNYLEKNTDLPDEQAGIASRASGGSLSKALKMDSDYLSFRKKLIKELSGMNKKSTGHISGFVEEYDKKYSLDSPDSLRGLFDLLTCWLRDMILISTGSDSNYITFTDLLEYSRRFAFSRTTRQLVSKAKKVENTWLEVTRLNVNKKLAIENLVLEIVS